MKVSILSIDDKYEFEKYYFLRWKILRKPFNQSFGTERDDLENDSIHFYIKNDNMDIIAIGRLHLINDKQDGQIRFMAVDEQYQRKGLGRKILKKIEYVALKKKVRYIFLHARENAIDFYIKGGYSKIEKSHLLFGEIQHWLMKKKLSKLSSSFDN